MNNYINESVALDNKDYLNLIKDLKETYTNDKKVLSKFTTNNNTNFNFVVIKSNEDYYNVAKEKIIYN